jgi:maltooligosyltrehalose trehalohydrolase
MFAWYRDLIRLRRTCPSLNRGAAGNTLVIFDELEQWIRMERGEIIVVCNLGASERTFPVSTESTVLLSSHAAPQNIAGEITLPSDAVVVLAVAAPCSSSHQLKNDEAARSKMMHCAQ